LRRGYPDQDVGFLRIKEDGSLEPDWQEAGDHLFLFCVVEILDCVESGDEEEGLAEAHRILSRGRVELESVLDAIEEDSDRRGRG